MGGEKSIFDKIADLNWTMLILIVAISCFGFVMLYSAADGNLSPWAIRQVARFIIFFPIMIAIALTPIRIWLRFAYIFYGLTLVLLALVDILGYTAMGATRWIDLGPISIQPSEPMKIFLVLALARYFHSLNIEDIDSIPHTIPPLLMVLLPVGLIYLQPDLGTAVITLAVGGFIFFLTGIAMWKFILIGALTLSALPVVWHFMHDYQRDRVLQFIDPGRDPLGAGYNITQSKIAIGSGGFSGKGLMEGTQSQLSFLPEKQTDFIFTMLSEELGFIGGVAVIVIYFAILYMGLKIAVRSRNHYGRIVAGGATVMLFLHVFINTGMVMGLLPVVGVPLPMVSYGGTIMITAMFSLGFILNADLYRNELLDRNLSS